MGKSKDTKPVVRKSQRNMVLIHNSEGKILLMKPLSKLKSLRFPTFSGRNDEEAFGPRYASTFYNMPSFRQNLVKLFQFMMEEPILALKNNKLSPATFQKMIKYYSFYHDLTKEEIGLLMNRAYVDDVEWIMMSPSQIESYCEESFYDCSSIYGREMLAGMMRATEELEKRLTYEKY